jgi:hypothetical protein
MKILKEIEKMKRKNIIGLLCGPVQFTEMVIDK